MKIAVLQTIVTDNKEKNLQEAEERIRSAAERGAELAVLPEMFCCPYSGAYFRAFSEPAGGRIWSSLAEAAVRYKIAVAAGSMPESEDGRLYNTSFVFDSDGRQIARHRKMHLFDVDFRDGQYFKESDTFSAGDEVTLFDLGGMRFGLCICFDMRFPELTRLMALQGAEAVVVPAAFNRTTGPMHWETMFRQRAADDQVYTIGCAPAADENAEYVSYGNSIICSPLGRILQRAGTGPEMLLAEIDPEAVREAREQLPLLPARRTDIYEVREKVRTGENPPGKI
ncbi:MAG: carbon-nitrogen hydrolase family protein [Lachnospiraceae bacterium]|nr:carbon-nitrogen hydrolase family protein [Lachnospiraceae bacterium]